MGMTIHYEGRLRDVRAIDELVAEVSEVADLVGWTREAIEDETLRGIVLDVHEDCDPVVLLVDRDGILRFPSEEFDEPSRQVFVKTQRAPAETHMAIVTLFRHLEARYFAEFSVDDESGYWETGDRQEFVKHHSCVAVLTDRFTDAPANIADPAPEVGGGDLVARLECALAAVTGDGFDPDDKVLLEDDDPDQAFPEPKPPHPDVLMSWHVQDWIDHFESHDRSRNSFLGFMSGREESEAEFAAALKLAEEDDERWERKTRSLIKRRERELEERRSQGNGTDGDLIPEDGDGPELAEQLLDEPWTASLPDFAPPFHEHVLPGPWSGSEGDPVECPRSTLTDDPPSDEWAEIAAECPAMEAALDLMRAMARNDREHAKESPIVIFVHGSISTTIIGVSMGYYHWSRSEGFPLARTARYVIAAQRFEQIARLLEGLEEPALRDFAPRARSIAADFRTAAEESSGGRRWKQ